MQKTRTSARWFVPMALLCLFFGLSSVISQTKPETQTQTARIIKTGKLGTPYGIQTADGQKLEPNQALNKKFWFDSLDVILTYKTYPKIFRPERSWGTPVKIKTIQFADSTLIATTGTVAYQELFDGFFGIIDGKGNKLRPEKPLTQKLAKNGNKVRVLYRKRPPTFSIYMWGEPIEVVKIYKL